MNAVSALILFVDVCSRSLSEGCAGINISVFIFEVVTIGSQWELNIYNFMC